jgi:type II secretory pathway component PulC
MENVKMISLCIIFVLIIISFIFGLYYLKRTINYNLYYKGQVEQTVKEMVKPEYLKEIYR